MLKRTALAVFALLFVIGSLFTFRTSANAQTSAQQPASPQGGSNNPTIEQSNNPYAVPNTNPDVPKNLHTFTQSVFLEVLSTISCQLSGIDPANPTQKCLAIDVNNGKIGFSDNSGGALGLAQKGIAMMFSLPVHSSDYANYLASNFGLSKHAYAASASACANDSRGIGFCGLSPIIGLWSAFRNIAYLLFVLVFIGVGFAIMLRIKIDPRTVMTIENSLPRVIISLILITFSFAISGFLVDLMYVTIYASHSIISQADNSLCNGGDNISNRLPIGYLQNNGPFEAANSLQPCNHTIDFGISSYAGTIAKELRPVIQKMIGVDSDFGVGGILHVIGSGNLGTDILNSLGNVIGSAIPGFNPDTSRPSAADYLIDGASNILGGLAFYKIFTAGASIKVFGNSIAIPATLVAATSTYLAVNSLTELTLRVFAPYLIVYIIVLLAVLWATFRLWYELIKAFIFILIGVVFSPFWILAGAFPGENLGIGPWLRDIVANLSAFPVAITMFLLGKVFIDAFANSKDTFLLPPLISSFASSGQVIGAILSVGIILLTPQVVVIMKEKLKAPEFKFTAGIGQAVGVGASTPISTLRSTGGYMKEIKYNPYDPASHVGGRGAFWRIMGRITGG